MLPSSSASPSSRAVLLAVALVLALAAAPVAAASRLDGNETTTDASVGNDSDADVVRTTEREHGSSNADLIAWAIGVLVALGAVTVVVLMRD